MRQIVRDGFFDYSAKREGFTPFMYADTLNLITTGIGNLIDAGPRNSTEVTPQAMAPAMGLPWFHKGPGWNPKNPVTDGVRASQSEIADAWAATKRAGIQAQGGFKYQNTTSLTLDMDGLKTLFNKTLSSFDAALAKHYPGYEQWPADAQLAILSMSWAMGPAFHPALGFQGFFNAVSREDFEAAKPEAVFKGGGSLTDPKSRNFAHQIMFQNAANVVKAGADRDRLFFPGTSDSAPAVNPSNAVARIPAAKPSNVATIAGGIAVAGVLGFGIFKWWQGRSR